MTTVALWLWATWAGLDLVSLLQALFSRPLVVGVGTGLLLGDPEVGLRVGAVLELFALDVVPVGSSRYPDFGAATAAATVAVAGASWDGALGVATGLGLALAWLAGATLPPTRRLNARIVGARADRLSAGDPAAIVGVHLTCLAVDTIRSGGVAAAALGVGAAIRMSGWSPDPALGRALTVVALGGAGWAVMHGALASGRSGPRWRWLSAGVAGGVLAAAWL
ncbi:MAG: PTS sugar transporter subunit IIC [Gemmatimonadales bacterium]|nr:PTS sugar transporter subunit IIC [Gemmatimonadales bacterium]